MERSSMWRACASKRAFRIGVLCAILTPVAKVMAKRLKHTQNDPNKEHVTINSRLCADLPTHGRIKMIKMTSTSGSFFMEESRPIDVPPYFNGTNYRRWKRFMMIFIQAHDMEAWMIIEKGYSSPTKKEKK
ncbi:hypothetical protein F3Y22_tig00012395pilonHSYRG00007 [Hibiscus syriacus]|uniref:Uncharacterized protein n=1 Tax=Hibiscus syriacus TaxID=106335 RepID=A0A6A3C3R0_HIBSY|nr:hypothetical protein F3Y22_tig00012395pilonHSYRG00007 [Hibiscus syriacus]